MGNRTYAHGDMKISPGLEKEKYDELNQYMTKMFGSWPQWVLEKPEWDDVTLNLESEGEWEKMDDWQDQLAFILKWLKQRNFHVEGHYDWQDETRSARLHIDTSHKELMINTYYVKVTCPPEWGSGIKDCYPKPEGQQTWPE